MISLISHFLLDSGLYKYKIHHWVDDHIRRNWTTNDRRRMLKNISPFCFPINSWRDKYFGEINI